MKKLDFIDSLRGLAILGVLISHVGQSIEGLPLWLKLITSYGMYGVQLFFVVSAYTLCLSAKSREKEKNKIRNFFIRRFFRIAPTYYVGILVYLGISILNNYIEIGILRPDARYTTFNIFTNLIFVHGFYPKSYDYIVPGGWSIGTEMAFYAIFPLLFFIYEKKIDKTKKSIIFPIAVAIICCLFWRSLPKVFPPLSRHNCAFYYCNLFNQLPVFLIGMSLFLISDKLIVNKQKSWIGLLLFIICTLILSFFRISDITFSAFISGISFILLFISFKNLSILNISLLKRIGQLSFSIYVFHFIFAWNISKWLNDYYLSEFNSIVSFFVCLFITLCCSIAFANLTEKFIEQKGIRLGSKLIKKLDSYTLKPTA